MVYKTNREKVSEYFEKQIIPAINNQDLDYLDYYKVLDGVSSDLSVSKNVIKAVLNDLISSGKLGEHRVLTISSKKVDNWLKNLVTREKETDEEVKKILGE